MPELPEVEITARRLDEALRGARIVSALAPGVKAMRTFDPPLSALEGKQIERVGRRGKHFVIEIDGGLALLIHLMSAGRLQLYDRRAGPRDRASRLLVRVRLPGGDRGASVGGGDAGGTRTVSADGGAEAELRLREFGSRQAAWVKLLRIGELDGDEAIASLGPEAWPQPPPLAEVLDPARPLHAVLRDQHAIAGIGRSWVDEILWQAKLSPFKRAGDLDAGETATLRCAIAETLAGAIEQYEQTVFLPIPDKLPMPLQVHRHEGEPCPRCATKLLPVHFEDYVIAYCPTCQTGGRKLKDRRLSRLLK
ncbi:MAG TPA: DNA-formamidopyrimidine glycosylase family protein [Solirubrobacteraceae bacterium]|jgi:formamidopyrimidine-DNA glycosylase|nr:DNA-formamidopyrimidine glycosylase family protein [Solirubrobacteraceae bacterium]